MFRRLICLASLALVLGVAGNAQAILVGHWKLDGSAADSSFSGLDGEITGSPNWVDGKVGLAMEIDGDDWIEIPGTSATDGYAGLSGEVTWAVWFKTSNAGVIGSVMTLGPAGAAHVQGNRSINVEAAGDIMIRAHSVGALTTPRSVATVADGEWHHVAVTIAFETDGDNDTMKVYIDGDLSQGYETTDININLHSGPGADFIMTLGARGTTPFVGLIDDARVYDHVLTEPEILAAMAGGGGGFPLALLPNPQDGALLEAMWANLSWRAGSYAVSHDLYFGTSFDDVNDGAEGTFAGNLGVTTQVVGFFGFPAPDGLQPGATYYWRVDEVNDANVASPWKGDVWSFSIPPNTAYNNSPTDGAPNVLGDVTLSWTPGMGASLHHVYFGDSLDEVSNAAGAPPLTDATFVPATLEVEKTYYWRVDEFDSTGTTHKGDIWSFTTVPDIAVTNPNLTLWWTLDEGDGSTAVDWSGHGNHGALVGGAPWADGYQGTALTFEDDVYVEAAGYPGVTGAAPRTCCAWIRATATGNLNIMTWGLNVAGQKWRMRIDSTGGLRIEVNGGSNVGVTNIADGRWHHVAVTFEDDGTPDALDTLLYVDGQLDAIALSADEPIDTAATGVVRIGESPWHNQAFVGPIDDARIYDKALTAEEIQQVMLGDTKLAGSPVPDSAALVDIRDISSLSWSAGDTAVSHDVYFGTDRDAVAGADNTAAQFQGNQTGTSLSLASLVEFGGGDYYWRIDEVEAGGTMVAGTIWKFTVPDQLIVDDFESYNDIDEGEPGSNRIYLTWIDGFGTTTNGSQAGNLDPPFMSQGRNSAQAMPLLYDNAGKTSEATMTLVSNKDWTEHGVTKLVVWFSGDSANAAERMFVALGNAVVYHPDDAATQDTGWNEWVIDLQEFTNQGADLTNVGSITLGFGTRNAPVATGGMGTVEFDDIGLIR